MFSRSRVLRPLVAVVVAVVVTALMVAVPLLDQGRDPGALAFAESGTTTGYVEHHHGVCLQYGAAAWFPALAADLPSELLVHETDDLDDTAYRAGRSFLAFHHSRAPPTV